MQPGPESDASRALTHDDTSREANDTCKDTFKWRPSALSDAKTCGVDEEVWMRVPSTACMRQQSSSMTQPIRTQSGDLNNLGRVPLMSQFPKKSLLDGEVPALRKA